MEATFKPIEFVRKKADCKLLVQQFHSKAKTAVTKKNYKVYESVMHTLVFGNLPDILVWGSEVKRKGATTPDEQLALEYYELFEDTFGAVVHQSWLSYMNKKFEKGDTIIFKFLMLFLTENFYESWKVSEPRDTVKTMVRNSVLA